ATRREVNLSASETVGDDSTGRCDKHSHDDEVSCFLQLVHINKAVQTKKLNLQMSKNHAEGQK
ncbi:hypothetical protein ACQP3J_31000, partial [Escherichia coli]